MTLIGKIFISILVLMHLFAGIKLSHRISSCKTQSLSTKWVWAILVFGIPVLGYIVVYYFLKPQESIDEIKDLRKQDMDKHGNHPGFKSTYSG